MKNFLKHLISLAILAYIVYITYQYATKINLTQNTDLIIFGALCLILGLGLGTTIFGIMLQKVNTCLNMYKRQLEKTSIGNDESSSKVKRLEAKIAVLEKSLSDALNK